MTGYWRSELVPEMRYSAAWPPQELTYGLLSATSKVGLLHLPRARP